MRKTIAYTSLILLFVAGFSAYMFTNVWSDATRSHVLSYYFGTGAELTHPDRLFIHSEMNAALDSNEVWYIENGIPLRWDTILRSGWIKIQKNKQIDSSGAPNGLLTLYASDRRSFAEKDSLRRIAYVTIDTGQVKAQEITVMDRDSTIRRFNYLIANYLITKTYGPDTVSTVGYGNPDSITLILDLQIVD